jgi:hypothetical protein
MLAIRLAVAIMAALPLLALPARGDFSGAPPEVVRVLQHDWCSPSSYVAARSAAQRAGHALSRTVRDNLAESEQAAAKYPRGCRLAERAAIHTRDLFHRRPPWTHRGPHGDACASHALPLRSHWRHEASMAAARATARPLRPILVGAAPSIHAGRSGQVVYACGHAVAGRSVTVGLTLTDAYPSASASTSIVAVAHFRHYGWRVWMVLH